MKVDRKHLVINNEAAATEGRPTVATRGAELAVGAALRGRPSVDFCACHSFRSVNVGSIPVALSDGIRHATAPTSVSRQATATNVTGSTPGVANSSAVITLLSANAPTTPTASPNSINVNACRIIIVKIRTSLRPVRSEFGSHAFAALQPTSSHLPARPL